MVVTVLLWSVAAVGGLLLYRLVVRAIASAVLGAGERGAGPGRPPSAGPPRQGAPQP